MIFLKVSFEKRKEKKSRRQDLKKIHSMRRMSRLIWVYLSKVVRTCKSVICTVNSVFSGPLKIDKTKVFKTNGSLMMVESIAECSHGAFCNTFDLH